MRFDKALERNTLDQLLNHRDDHIVFPGAARPDGNILIGRDHLRQFMRRYLYKLFVDAGLSRGEFLLPNCGVYDCQNPFHALRSPIAGHIATHCVNGHRYGPKDFGPNGDHLCRQCLAKRRARARKPAEATDPHLCRRGHDLRKVGVYRSTDKDGRIHQTCKRCKLDRLHAQRKAS